MNQSQPSTVATTTKWSLVLASALLGSLPAAPVPDVCVLAPDITTSATAPPTATIPLSRPTLFIREPLVEIRLERDGALLWRASPPLATPLEGPRAWPLDPLQPNQRLTLRLRPLGADPGQFATIRLQAAGRPRLEAGDTLLRSLLAGPPTAWRPTLETLLAKGDRPLATALLFAREGPDEPSLNALRLEAARTSCR